MRLITRTIYGGVLQTDKQLGLPHLIPNNSSLNQAVSNFSVDGVSVVDGAKDPTVSAYASATDTAALSTKYLVIGNGGHKNYTGADGADFTAPLPHRATDAGLYNWIPFVLRLPNNDLPSGSDADPQPLTRAMYRLRRIITVDGQDYIAYFARLIDLDGVATEMQRINYVQGTEQAPVAFVPGSTDLQPTAPNIATPGTIPTDGSYLAATAAIALNFTAAEVNEIKNAVTVLQGSELNAIVSEIALVSGADKTAQGFGWDGSQLASNVVSYQEAVGMQAITHVSAYYPLVYTNAGFDIDMDLGATEPLFGEGA